MAAAGGLTAISSIPIATAVTDGVRVVDPTVDSETVTVVLRIDEMSIPYRKLLAYIAGAAWPTLPTE